MYTFTDIWRLQLWYLTPLSRIFQIYRGVSFIGEGNRSTRRKPPDIQVSAMLNIGPR